MKCPFCDREEVQIQKGVYTCDCPQYGYEDPAKRPKLSRPNPGYIAFEKAHRRANGEPAVWVPQARIIGLRRPEDLVEDEQRQHRKFVLRLGLFALLVHVVIIAYWLGW